jgi:hypothetical protein
VTPLCPNGHASTTSDYCDQCGAPIGASTPATGAGEEIETSPAVREEPCPSCGTARTGDDRFCEGCGYDFAASPGTADAAGPAIWEAVATADRQQFERCTNPGVEFPGDYGSRRFALASPEVRIGRSRGRAGETVPEINLAGAPEDPAISHLHAVLERLDDGSYALRDLGSTNGTAVNEDPTPLAADIATPLADGDRIRIGAWTTITVRKGSGNPR